MNPATSDSMKNRRMARTMLWRWALGLAAALWPCVGWRAAALADAPQQAAGQVSNDNPAADQMPATTEDTPAAQSVESGTALASSAPEQIPEGVAEPGSEHVLLPDGFVVPPIAGTRDWFMFHNWYTNTDFTVLDHSRYSRPGALVEDLANFHSFRQQDLALGIAPGLRWTIGAELGDDYLCHDHTVEFTFRGLEDWDRTYNFDSGSVPHALFTPLDFNFITGAGIAGFNGADTYAINYNSRMNSFEVNYRTWTRLGHDQLVYDPDLCSFVRQVGNGATFSYLFGLRDLEFDENLSIFSRQNGVDPSAFAGNYINGVHNNLAGVQFGGELDYQYQRWMVGIVGKVAPSVNFADQTVDVLAIDTATPGRTQIPQTHVATTNDGPACISEFSMQAAYQLQPNVRLRFAYDFEWLTSVALAPSQLSQLVPGGNPQRIVVSNGTFFNGLSAGIDIMW